MGGSQLQGSRSRAMTTRHPRDDPLRSASPSRPSSPWVGERARPLYAGGNQCLANVRFPGGGWGGALHKRCIVSIARSRLPPRQPARWRRPQRRARSRASRPGEGEVRPSLRLGNVGREAGVKEGRGERERGREEGAGRLGELRGGGSQSEGGGRAGGGRGVMAGNPEEAREREPNEVAPREAGEQARDRG